jgi:DNA-directed RNA polymerase subunit RPC12/RpoP
MAFIKTTNVVLDDTIQIEKTIRTVQCPYCKVYLKGISLNITAMKCWKCKKEFRIQQDKSKFGIGMPNRVKRTLLGRL